MTSLAPLAVESIAVESIRAPSISYAALAPILVVLGAALVGVLVEAFVPRPLRRVTQVAVALIGLVGALIAVIRLAGTSEVSAASAVAVDGPTLFLQGTLAVLGIGSVLLLGEKSLDSGGGAVVAQAAVAAGTTSDRQLAEATYMQTEVFPLTMFALGGMMLFPAANDLLIMFVALEVLSLPLYLLAGLARRRRLLSQEAALKYFLLGAFASAFFLYGLALLYGYAGTVRLAGIFAAAATPERDDLLLFLGLGLLLIGLLFKAGVAPFHSWTPDVYQGAPTPVTALMAACTKVAAFGALLRVLHVGFGNTTWDWRPAIWGVAIITMVVGALVAITQTDLKRMLAYSSIAHAGFLLCGVVAVDRQGLASTMFYLLAYGLTTLGAFAIVTLVRNADGEANQLAQWSGLGRRSPLTAGLFGFFLFSLAGIPLTSGFTGKFAVFNAAVDEGAAALVVVGVVTSAVAAFFYVRVVVAMFFNEPAVDGPTVSLPGGFTAAVIALGAVATLVLGVFPQPVLELATDAASFVGT